MASVREWTRRLWGTISRNPRDCEIEEELRSHLEPASEDMLRHGGSTEDAARAARLKAGGVAQAMETMRDQRGLPWLDDVTRDVRHALRSLRRSPVFTAVALLFRSIVREGLQLGVTGLMLGLVGAWAVLIFGEQRG